jgi:hypothetical protein
MWIDIKDDLYIEPSHLLVKDSSHSTPDIGGTPYID